MRIKKGLTVLKSRIIPVIEKAQTVPEVFVDKIVKFSILSFFVLLIGCYAGLHIKSVRFFGWSVVISACCAIKAFRLLWYAEKGEYDMLEGTVTEIKGKHSPGRCCMVRLQLDDGADTWFLIDKKQRIQMGRKYRLYFSRKQGILSGIKSLDVFLNVGSFYGFEEIK